MISDFFNLVNKPYSHGSFVKNSWHRFSSRIKLRTRFQNQERRHDENDTNSTTPEYPFERASYRQIFSDELIRSFQLIWPQARQGVAALRFFDSVISARCNPALLYSAGWFIRLLSKDFCHRENVFSPRSWWSRLALASPWHLPDKTHAVQVCD